MNILKKLFGSIKNISKQNTTVTSEKGGQDLNEREKYTEAPINTEVESHLLDSDKKNSNSTDRKPSKRGFGHIGFLHNINTYFNDLEKKSGMFFDHNKFNTDIDNKWGEKDVRCFNLNLDNVKVEANDILFVLIETPLKSQEHKEKLYGGFWRNSPSKLSQPSDYNTGPKKNNWQGVKIGTEDEVLSFFKTRIGLKDWAYIPPEELDYLEELALPEKWYYGDKPTQGGKFYKYPILWSYLNNTFKKLQADQRDDNLFIQQSNKYALFNTGLLDKHYCDIYAFFVKNPGHKQPWKLEEFSVYGQGKNNALILSEFPHHPQKADYFKNNIDNVLYDSERELAPSWEHIITGHCERYPIEFFIKNCPKEITDIDIEGQMYSIEEAASLTDWSKKKDYFKKLGEKIGSDEKIFNSLKNRVEAAITLAEKYAKQDYKIAVPMYYPVKNKMSFLLPLALVNSDVTNPDLALVIECIGDDKERKTYLGHTVLTLSMAYNNSRLIASPDRHWLKQEQIKQINMDEDNDCD